eukprot:11225197-Lingulodinium_polyedra.AAC.1
MPCVRNGVGFREVAPRARWSRAATTPRQTTQTDSSSELAKRPRHGGPGSAGCSRTTQESAAEPHPRNHKHNNA